MKKSIFTAVLISLVLVSVACAAPKALPAGSLVSAVCNGDNTATVNISGVQVESMEMYKYFLPLERLTSATSYAVNLDEGRRFNFTFDGGFYAGLSKEMAKRYGYPASFLGNNMDVDNSDDRGAAFIITCPSVKVKTN